MQYLTEGPLAQLWESIAFKEGLSPETVSKIDINRALNALKSTKEVSLPVAGELLHALSKVLDTSAEFALEDAKETNRELYNTFKEQISVNDGGEIDQAADSAPPMQTGLELGSLSLPDSLIGRRNQRAPEDISIDAIVREDRPMDGNPVEEAPQRSAEELEVLEGLDLQDEEAPDATDAFEFPTIPDSDEGLEFGSDLPQSSSPPRTPAAEGEIDVQIGDMSSPQPEPEQQQPRKQARRHHGAPVDDIISISRPTRPTAQILRPKISVSNVVDVAQQPGASVQDQRIPLGDAFEQLVDPAYVQAEMKRRRMGAGMAGETQGDNADHDEDMVDRPDDDAENGAIDFEADWDMDIFDDNQPSPLASDSDNGDDHEEADDDDNDTEEVLKEGAAAAKAVLSSHLRKKGSTVMLDAIATSAKTRADTLLEVLNLAAQGRVRPLQEDAWGPIKITKV